jgi:hypothetical protein
MTAPWTPPPIDTVFDPPQLGDSKVVFDGKAFALVGHLNVWSAEVNAVTQYLQSVAEAAMQAAALANFKGAWSANTGPMAKPASVAWGNELWALLEDLDQVELHEPSLSSTKWARVRESADRVTYGAGSVADSLDLLKSNPVFTGSVNGGQIAGLRNKILNGRMEFQQIPVASVPAGTSYYTADQWVTASNTAADLTTDLVPDAPAGSDFQFSHRITVSTADTSIGAGDNAWFGQPIEGWNVRDLVGRTFTFGFWAKSSKAGVYCVAFKNASTHSYVAEITINAANTWEYKTVTVVGGLPTAGTWDYTTGLGLYVIVSLAAGATHHTAAGAWQTGSFMAAANQVNLLDTAGATFHMTGAHLERGAALSPDMFEHRQLGFEEWLLQRYCELGVAGFVGVCTNGQAFAVPISFKARKRVPPAVSYVPGSVSSTVGAASPLATAYGNDCMTFQITASATGAAAVQLQYQAIARL